MKNVLISAFTKSASCMEVFYVFPFCHFAFIYFVAIPWSLIAKEHASNSEDISLFLVHNCDVL